VIVARVCM